MQYPPGSYVFRIGATGGTLSDVTDFVDVTLTLACGVSADEFIWLVPEESDMVVIRKDYIPGWTVSAIVDPFNQGIAPVYSDPASCTIELPITWTRTTYDFDETG